MTVGSFLCSLPRRLSLLAQHAALSVSALLTSVHFPRASAHLRLCVCCFFFFLLGMLSILPHKSPLSMWFLLFRPSDLGFPDRPPAYTEWVQPLPECFFPHLWTNEGLSCVLCSDGCPQAAAKSPVLMSACPVPRVGLWQHPPNESRDVGPLVLLPGNRIAMLGSL